MTKLTLSYPARISKDGDGFLVDFRDLGNIFSSGESRQEAVFNAQEALDLVLEEMHQDGHDIPGPGALQKNEVLIPVSPEVAVPILLRKLRNQHHYTYGDVARVMGVAYQTYQQIEAGKNITLKSLKKAAMALGATVEIGLLTS